VCISAPLPTQSRNIPQVLGNARWRLEEYVIASCLSVDHTQLGASAGANPHSVISTKAVMGKKSQPLDVTYFANHGTTM